MQLNCLKGLLKRAFSDWCLKRAFHCKVQSWVLLWIVFSFQFLSRYSFFNVASVSDYKRWRQGVSTKLQSFFHDFSMTFQWPKLKIQWPFTCFMGWKRHVLRQGGRMWQVIPRIILGQFKQNVMKKIKSISIFMLDIPISYEKDTP